jgi:hypothetical protein
MTGSSRSGCSSAGCIAPHGVTQKAALLAKQWLHHGAPQIFLSRISALIHFRLLGSIWRPRYERHSFCFA